MNPLIVDVILLILSLFLIYGGYRQGFIRAAGSLLGLVASIAIAIWGVTWLEQVTGFEITNSPITFVMVFLVLAVIVSQILRLVVGALDLVRKLLSILPFVGMLNSLLGVVLGGVQAVVMIGVVAYMSLNFLPEGEIKTAVLQAQSIDQALKLERQFGLIE